MRTAIGKCTWKPNWLKRFVQQHPRELEFYSPFEDVRPRLNQNSLIEQSGKIAYTSLHRLFETGDCSRQVRRVSRTLLSSIQNCRVDVQAGMAIGKCNWRQNGLKRCVQQHPRGLEFVQSIWGFTPTLHLNSLMEKSGNIAYTSVHRLYETGAGSRLFRRVSRTLLTSIQIYTVDVQARTAIGKCNWRPTRLKRCVQQRPRVL